MQCVRMTEDEFEACKEVARELNNLQDSTVLSDRKYKFTSRRRYPTVEELEHWKASDHFREWFPFLLYYREPDLFKSDDPEFSRTRKYLSELFFNQLRIVDDELLEKMDEVKPRMWLDFSEDEKIAFLDEYAQEFDADECDAFVLELRKRRFMRNRTKKDNEIASKELVRLFHIIKNITV